ncbi:glutathione S-transferase 1-like isoform X2 [Choristoneura fumiferana]
MTNKLVLYGDEASPPVQFVMMAGSMLNIEMDFRHIDIFKAENRSDFYTKINPLQKVPALRVDGDVIISDSHAIAMYLCSISDSQNLYPEDPVTRARVNQLMFFNAGTLFPIDSLIFTQYFRGNWPPKKTKIEQWYSALDHLEYRLTNNRWLVNDKMCLGDICCATTVGSLQLLVPLLDRHVKLSAWINRIRQLPCFQIHLRGVQRLKAFVETSS